MKIEKLIKMANEIGTFFEAEPERPVALDGVAGHLRRFWEPRMRRQLVEWVRAGNSEGLRPLVLDAIKAKADTLAPPV